ncbi:hypothetical protein PR048_033384 [Dryococelus australis]|uniref:Uncharacterized protein n=1 Tax=Dryococelus australis TaxID=614101 RepID=A0ABQ9G4A9_9NEOP|nr:hypothetical protein PR048_033384 [Dryococelus australis]
MSLGGGFSRGTPVSPALAFQRRSILGSHFLSYPWRTATYGSQLESPSLETVSAPATTLEEFTKAEASKVSLPPAPTQSTHDSKLGKIQKYYERQLARTLHFSSQRWYPRS